MLQGTQGLPQAFPIDKQHSKSVTSPLKAASHRPFLISVQQNSFLLSTQTRCELSSAVPVVEHTHLKLPFVLVHIPLTHGLSKHSSISSQTLLADISR